MFRAEHEEALRHQIRSLERVQLSDVDAFGQEFNQVVKDQRALLEEIRIEIHNQLMEGRIKLVSESIPDVNKRTIPKMRDLANGILV